MQYIICVKNILIRGRDCLGLENKASCIKVYSFQKALYFSNNFNNATVL